jgi:hypothetical protein
MMRWSCLLGPIQEVWGSNSTSNNIFFLKKLKYSNWLDLLWRLDRLDPCKQLCDGLKRLDMRFSMTKNLHINLTAFIDPHTYMRRTEPHFNTMDITIPYQICWVTYTQNNVNPNAQMDVRILQAYFAGEGLGARRQP